MKISIMQHLDITENDVSMNVYWTFLSLDQDQKRLKSLPSVSLLEV